MFDILWDGKFQQNDPLTPVNTFYFRMSLLTVYQKAILLRQRGNLFHSFITLMALPDIINRTGSAQIEIFMRRINVPVYTDE